MNKKAASMLVGIIIGLILLLVVSVVYYTFFQKVSVSTKGAVVDSVCRASLDLTAAKIKGPFGVKIYDPGFQPKCEIYDVVITQKDINLVSAKTKESDENAIKRIIAEIMTQGIVVTTKDAKGNLKRRAVGGMWATVSRGQKKFFEDKAGRFCLPWATISFEDKVKEKIPSFKEFSSYLLNTPYKEGSSLTYYSYLSNLNENAIVSDKVALKKALAEDRFDTSKTHALFFVQVVPTNWDEILTMVGAIFGFVGGVVSVFAIPITGGASILAFVTVATATMGTTGSVIGGIAMGNYAADYIFVSYDAYGISKLSCDYLK